jgi:hypothetical protein
MNKIAICAIFKNEKATILEWIAYHRVIGIDKFILYDNGSTDGTAQMIKCSRFRTWVEIVDWPQRPGQLAAYSHFITSFAEEFRWVAFIDCDEFLHPLDADHIKPVLQRYEAFPAVLVNWLNFGPNGHQSRPEGLSIVNYLTRLPDNADVHRHVKCVAQPRSVLGVGDNPHVLRLDGDPCDAEGQATQTLPIQERAVHAHLVINHYYTRSRHEWYEKVAKGRADNESSGLQRNPDWFDHFVRHAVVRDARICRFAPRVEALLRE